MTRAPFLHRIAALIAPMLLALGAASVHAAIPAGERGALLAFYASTNAADVLSGGSGDWTGASGSECGWYGVKCNAGGTTVTKILLPGINLTGKLPASLTGLPNLSVLDVSNNQLTGSIPSIAGMASLLRFDAGNNRLTGSIPSLAGVSGLSDFSVAANSLTGPIPSLSGLANLTAFNVAGNQLSGSIPALAGLGKLTSFNASANLLTGSIPALTGLLKLSDFSVSDNQLTGQIPALTGLTNLANVDVSNNQLTGSIPPLSDSTNLLSLDVGFNKLSGAIPSLSGLPNLTHIGANDNQLVGTIPALAGLQNIQTLDVSFNQLTGSIPSLAGLSNLALLRVDSNQLVGDAPAAPSPSAFVPGLSALCPNNLNHAANSVWDAATGQTPWYGRCVALPANANMQGLWWNAAESGWGVNLAHQGEQIYATWYTYDAAGNAYWLSMLAPRTTSTSNDYRGDVYADVGPPFNDFTGTGTASRVGTGTLTFSDVNSASFAYNVNAGGASYVKQAKSITRYVLNGASAQPVCTYLTSPNLAAASNYQDLWWVPAESGWGVNFAHQGDQIFATWYTYDAKNPGSGNAPLWLSALMTRQGTANAFTGPLVRTSGQRFDAYAPNYTAQTVGTATVTFADGNNGTFAYVTNGSGGVPPANQTKAITRFLFAAPAGTTCQ